MAQERDGGTPAARPGGWPPTPAQPVTLAMARHVSAPDRRDARGRRILPPPAPGVPGDVSVLTPSGQRLMADLAVGDRVVARDRGAVRILARGQHRQMVQAVRVLPGALGPARPLRSLVLPAGTEILLRDWRARSLFGARRALVPLGRLVDGMSILALGPQVMTLTTLYLPAPHILYAEGIEVSAPGAD